MNPTLTLACLALTGCTAFTAPADPITGILQDAPAEWAATPDPLDSFEVLDNTPLSEGNFGHEWMWR